MQGWLKLHRQLADNPIWLIKPFSEGQAWVDLLMITTFDSGFIKTKNGTIIKLNRGQCGFSQLTLSERWGWSRGKVNRYLKLLESEKMIQQKIVANTTIINILNYDDFQNDTINNTINDTINGQQTIQQTDTIKNDKNEKNVENDIEDSPTAVQDFQSQPIFGFIKKTFRDVYGFGLPKNNKVFSVIRSLVECDPHFEQAFPKVLRFYKEEYIWHDGSKPPYSWLLKDPNNYFTVREVLARLKRGES